MGAPTLPPRRGDAIRVATWNIWWRHGDWAERRGAVLATLRALQADVVSLQEVCSTDPDQVSLLRDELGWNVAAAPDGDADRYGVVNAVASPWPIVDAGWEYLDVGDMPPHRTVLWCAVRAPQADVPVYSTHLSHGFDQSALRGRQLAQVARLVANRRGDPRAGFPPVVLGDLNAVPDSDEIRRLTGRAPVAEPGLAFTDAWAQAGEGPGVTYAGANPHVTDSAWPDRRLDYVLVGWPRPRPVGNPRAAWLFGVEPVDGVMASDHYGVAADLCVARGTGEES